MGEWECCALHLLSAASQWLSSAAPKCFKIPRAPCDTDFRCSPASKSVGERKNFPGFKAAASSPAAQFSHCYYQLFFCLFLHPFPARNGMLIPALPCHRGSWQPCSRWCPWQGGSDPTPGTQGSSSSPVQ